MAKCFRCGAETSLYDAGRQVCVVCSGILDAEDISQRDFSTECPQCTRLTADLDRLERAYAAALGVLTARAHIARGNEYNALRIAADEARIDSEVARLELEQHKRKHAKVN